MIDLATATAAEITRWENELRLAKSAGEALALARRVRDEATAGRRQLESLAAAVKAANRRPGRMEKRVPGGVVKYGADAKMLALNKRATVSSVNQSLMTATAVITTSDPDRQGDVVVPKGCRFDNFARNPTVLFGHGSMEFAVGKAEDPSGKLQLQIEDHRIVSTCYFSQSNPEAETVFGMIAEGVLRGVSIAFLVNRAVDLPRPQRDADTFTPVGMKVTDFDLVEWSFVNSPCNPNCLVLSHSAATGEYQGRALSATLRKQLAAMVG